MSRTIDYDPITRTRRVFHTLGEGEYAIETKQDVEPLTDDNKRRFRGVDERAPWRGDVHRVASIPLPLYFELKAKGIADDPTAFKKWLNDPDNRVFRTRPGIV